MQEVISKALAERLYKKGLLCESYFYHVKVNNKWIVLNRSQTARALCLSYGDVDITNMGRIIFPAYTLCDLLAYLPKVIRIENSLGATNLEINLRYLHDGGRERLLIEYPCKNKNMEAGGIRIIESFDNINPAEATGSMLERLIDDGHYAVNL